MTQGDECDKHLMQVLSHVVSQSTAVSRVQNDDEEYVEEEDYKEESNGQSGHSYEVISGNGEGMNEDNSNSNDDGDQSNSEEGSTTSAYESANENLSNKGRPQKCDETLQETECDVNGQTPQKHDETHDEDGLKSQKHDETHDEDGLKSQKCDETHNEDGLKSQKRDGTTATR